jgi:hypothetical protein
MSAINVVRRVALVAVVLAFAGPGAMRAQDGKSRAAAQRLGEVLDRRKLDSIAAPDPSAPDTFVAALYFAGAQLLVVSAQYAVPSLLETKLTNRDYRDIYIDLNSASVAGTKIFVMDQGADGLVAKPEESQGADTWEQANKTTTFDGDWRAAKLSEQDYLQAFRAADERYAQMLTVLADYAEQRAAQP